MLFPLFLARITRKQQKEANFTSLVKTQVNTWIGKNPNCVVVYSECPKTMKPLRIAIDDNSDFVSFALAEPNPESNKYCYAYPCASAYLNGRHVRSTISDFSPLDFQFWVSHTISQPHFDIVHPEELRRLLILPGYHLLAVDIEKRPAWIPKDQVLFHVKPEHMKRLNLMSKKGIYVFRHIDRELQELTTWDVTMFRSTLFDIGVDDLKSKKFIGAALIEHQNEETDQLKIILMKEFVNEYGNDFGFTVLSDSFAGHVSQASHFNNICGSLFLVVNTSDLSGKRWGLTDITEEYNVPRVRLFIEQIMNGTQPALISQDTRGVKHVIGVNELPLVDFSRRLYNKNHYNLVLVSSSCSAPSDEATTVLSRAAVIYQSKGIKFWLFDQGRNDIPQGFPEFDEYPVFLIYKKNTTQFVKFEKALTLPNFEKFIRVNTGVELDENEKNQFQTDVMKTLDNLMNQVNYEFSEEL